ncbi:MAG: hypothetical protein NC390_03165 [Fusobacterium sp.]|nr:hypothetical protein [Fusobacterium sp.]
MSDEMQEFDIESHEREVKKRLRQRRVRGKQNSLKHVHTFCRFILSSLLIAGVYYFVKLPALYISPDAFATSDTEVIRLINNRIVPTEKAYTLLSGFEPEHLPIFMQKTDELKKILLTLPPVEDVYIRRYVFPARMDFIFKERIPVISVIPDVTSQPFAYFTQDGTLVGKEYAPYIANFHTLNILSTGYKNDAYHDWKKENVDELLRFAKYVETCSKESVEYIDYRNPDDVFVKISSIKIRLGKLDDSAFERVQRLTAILPEIKLMDVRIKYLDLRWKDPYLKLE